MLILPEQQWFVVVTNCLLQQMHLPACSPDITLSHWLLFPCTIYRSLLHKQITAARSASPNCWSCWTNFTIGSWDFTLAAAQLTQLLAASGQKTCHNTGLVMTLSPLTLLPIPMTRLIDTDRIRESWKFNDRHTAVSIRSQDKVTGNQPCQKWVHIDVN